jgi:hypothetical protein
MSCLDNGCARAKAHEPPAGPGAEDCHPPDQRRAVFCKASLHHVVSDQIETFLAAIAMNWAVDGIVRARCQRKRICTEYS